VAGALFSQNVRTGESIASVDTGNGSLPLPLSAAKLLLAAVYLDNEPSLAVRTDLYTVIPQGSDSAGRKLAIDLRRALGSQRFLEALGRFGFPACSPTRQVDCTTLTASTPDDEWSNALSLGETDFNVTPAGLSHFLLLIARAYEGRGHGLKQIAAHRLTEAMLGTVTFGTARDSSGILPRIGEMGGKTGTTGVAGGPPYDGLFAGLIFDEQRHPRYTVVTYVRHGGPGGEMAAEISACFGRSLLYPGLVRPTC
jgi:hypothetical protein